MLWVSNIAFSFSTTCESNIMEFYIRCHDLGNMNARRKLFIDKCYKTLIMSPQIKQAVPIKTILKSQQFRDLNKMIKEYNLEYSGIVPLYSLEELDTLVIEVLGKPLTEYVTWAATPDYWENRLNSNSTGTLCMKELRTNYIKKAIGCCMGTRRNNYKCGRDIQNVTPFRLSMFHFDHGKYKSEKNANIRTLISTQIWESVEKELQIIEGVKCAWCHGGE